MFCCCSQKESGPVEEMTALTMPVSVLASSEVGSIQKTAARQAESVQEPATQSPIEGPETVQGVPQQVSAPQAAPPAPLAPPKRTSMASMDSGTGVHEVEISLFKNGPFGLDMGKETFTVLKVKEGGVVDAHNRKSPPEKQVLPGDVIVSINGTRGDARTLISEIARTSGTTALIVRRGLN
mmetsp:Transcript_8161/g.17809  ORF Transcript_8161/g.17809 Transcript_8161/m.17809 type:complete len:181 (-) Transcript_8161:172-714(-)